MKKHVLRVVAFAITLIMFANMLPLSVFATENTEETETMVLSVSSASGMPGETVQVTINLENNPGLASLKFDVVYDDVLNLTDVTFNSAFGSYITTPEPYTNPQTITLISPLSDISAEGTLATLTFEISEQAPDNYVAGINITCDANDVYNGNYDNIAFTVVNGSVTVYHGVPGDIDGDSKVNTKDAILLFRYVAGWDVDVDPAAINCNGDNKVDTKDAITLFRYVAGWPDIVLYRGEICTHTLSYIEAKAPTCTEAGNMAYWVCSSCETCFSDAQGESEMALFETVIVANGHSYDDWVCTKDATCTEAGEEHKNCSNCDFFETRPLEALGHTEEELAPIAPDYDNTGLEAGVWCPVCETILVEQEIIDKIPTKYHAVTYYNTKGFDFAEEYYSYAEHKGLVLPKPTADGYEFLGWYTASTGGTIVDYISAGETQDYHLYAQWKKVEYKITYKDELQSTTTYGNYSTNVGLESLSTPTKVGYTFIGWSESKQAEVYKNAVPENLVLMGDIPSGSEKDYVLYAHWKFVTYHIELMNAPSHKEAKIPYTIEDNVTLPIPEWAGLTFVNWTNENLEEVPYIVRGTIGDITLTANWKTKQNIATPTIGNNKVAAWFDELTQKYYLIYSLGTIENVVVEDIIDGVNSFYNANTADFTLQLSETTTIESSKAEEVAEIVAKSIITSNQWSDVSTELRAKSKTSTLDMGLKLGTNEIAPMQTEFEIKVGVSGTDSESYSHEKSKITGRENGLENTSSVSSTLAYRTEINKTVSETYTISKDQPSGYYSYVYATNIRVYGIIAYDPAEGNYYADTYSIADHMHSVVLYHRDANDLDNPKIETLDYNVAVENIIDTIENSYFVHYDANCGEGSMPMSMHAYDVESTLSSIGYTRKGYIFEGWEKEGNAKLYGDEATVKNLLEPNPENKEPGIVVLKAKWTPNEYEIVYDANGGNGNMEPSPYTFELSRPLKKNVFERLGYRFIGWNTKADGSGISYVDEENVCNLTHLGETVTLYAQWSPNTYQICYHANGGTGTTPTSYHTYDSANSLSANAFSRTGWIFDGWSLSPSGDAQYEDQQNVTNLTFETDGVVNLYAVWRLRTSVTMAWFIDNPQLVQFSTFNVCNMKDIFDIEYLDSQDKTFHVEVSCDVYDFGAYDGPRFEMVVSSDIDSEGIFTFGCGTGSNDYFDQNDEDILFGQDDVSASWFINNEYFLIEFYLTDSSLPFTEPDGWIMSNLNVTISCN